MTSEPPRWRVEATHHVERRLEKLPRDLLRRIRGAIRSLEVEPRPAGCVKLAGFASLYRIRVGDWRIIYSIEDERLVVLVIEVEPRGSVYRNL